MAIITTAQYESFEDCIAHAVEGDLVVVDRDYVMNGYATISADNITIIGNWHTLKAGDAINLDAVIGDPGLLFASGRNHITVKQLILDGIGCVSATGIKLLDSSDCILEQVISKNMPSTSTQSGYGIWVSGDSHRNTIRKCEAHTSGYSGFDCAFDDVGDGTIWPTDNTFQDNFTEGNVVDGFDIFQTKGTRLLGNTAIGNGSAGIRITQAVAEATYISRDITILGNNLRSNANYGLFVENGGTRIMAKVNNITGNGVGILLESVSETDVSENVNYENTTDLTNTTPGSNVKTA